MLRVFTIAPCVLALLASAAAVACAEQVIPLLDDTRFERGFTVWSPEPGSHVSQGGIRPRPREDGPVWGLAQWHSRFTLAEAERTERDDGSVRYFDGAKSVVFFPRDADADLALGLDGATEYRRKAPALGDPWPHLLAERSLAACPRLTGLETLRFSIRYRLVRVRLEEPPGHDPRRHTAQFVFYITVRNRNRQSPGFGDYYWFGVPMYDARYRLPREHKAKDLGSDRKPATGKFIFNPGGEVYTSQSAHDGDWVTIERDLLPLVREGLETAWQRGYLRDSRDPADYGLGGMNTGWEVTGCWNVEMQIDRLRLEAVPKKP
ncbi:MAG: hypothetical protein ACQESR_12505 [Planctomycetota bacterium]